MTYEAQSEIINSQIGANALIAGMLLVAIVVFVGICIAAPIAKRIQLRKAKELVR